MGAGFFIGMNEGGTIQNILIIAEKKIMGNTLMGCLHHKGYRSTTVESHGKVRDITDELGRNKYALVIATNTSLSPPQIRDIIPAIKNQSPDARIIVLSGFYNRDFVLDLEHKGADGCLPLPFDESVLMDKVKELLSPSAL